jgi:hypothetical protein
MAIDKMKLLSLVQAVDNMIERLSDPLLPSDQQHGWDEKSQAVMLKYYEDLRSRLANRGPLKPPDIYGLARGLNDLGISGGMLENSAYRIASELRAQKSLFNLGT